MKNPFKKSSDKDAPFQEIGRVKAAVVKDKKSNAYSSFANSLFVQGGNAFFSFLFIVLLLALLVINSVQSRYYQSGPLTEDRIVYIPRGANSDAIAQVLEDNSVISSASVFKTKTFQQAKNFKFGEYKFPKAVTMEQVAKILTEGKGITHSITLPEGLTSEQIVIRLYDNDVLTGDLTQIPVEGSLLPNTYTFQRGTTRGQIVQQMQREQRKHLDRIWATRTPLSIVKSPEELVTLASIVEKETGKADERPRVAGVFTNRLRTGMKLQSDPTIIYGIVGGKGSLGRGILRSEIDRVTPYNTYQIAGLPPTPIANPGIAAMEAVANPARTRDIFFVADGTGGHVFAETLDQHNRNVAKWRAIEKERAQ